MLNPASAETPVLRRFSWSWTSSFCHTRIMEGQTLVGEIADFSRDSIHTLCNQKIKLEYVGLFRQHIYFTDPADGKAYAQFDGDKITSPSRHCLIINGLLCEVHPGPMKPVYKKMVRLQATRNFWGHYKNSGEILVYHTEHLAVDLFSLFYHLRYHAE